MLRAFFFPDCFPVNDCCSSAKLTHSLDSLRFVPFASFTLQTFERPWAIVNGRLTSIGEELLPGVAVSAGPKFALPTSVRLLLRPVLFVP